MLVTVVRPARAGAILPISIVLVGAIALNVVMDLRNDATSLASEWAHLPELLSVPLVWLLSHPSSRWMKPPSRRTKGEITPVVGQLRLSGEEQR